MVMAKTWMSKQSPTSGQQFLAVKSKVGGLMSKVSMQRKKSRYYKNHLPKIVNIATYVNTAITSLQEFIIQRCKENHCIVSIIAIGKSIDGLNRPQVLLKYKNITEKIIFKG